MERDMSNAASWSNPESVQVENIDFNPAPEPEPFDTSTIDPSHIIYLIRQLLPSKPVADTVESLSRAVECEPSERNGIVQSPRKLVEGRSPCKKGAFHAELAAGISSTRQDKESDENISSGGSAREPAKVEPQTVVAHGDEQLTVELLVHANGHYPYVAGDHSRKQLREEGKILEQEGSSPAQVENGCWRDPEKVLKDSSPAAKVIKAEDNVRCRVEGGELERETENLPESDIPQKIVGEDDPREEAGCVLWDLAATESHANFMVENHVLEVLSTVLCTPHSDRMREICLGIFGNLACHAGPVKAVLTVEGLIPTLVEQLFVEDTPSLTEACRLLSAGLHSEVAVAWVTAIKPLKVLERIMWMAANTLNSQLLEKCTELILAMADSRRDAASVLLPRLLQLGLRDLLTDLIDSELRAISEGVSTRGDLVLDIVLQIAEALSISDEFASQLTASSKLFCLSCQIILLSGRDEIGPSGITATVLIANLLTEEAGLIQQVLHDPVLLGRLLALVPSAGDDPGARNALWSILGRICRWLVGTKPEGPPNGMVGMITVLADGCSLLLDDLDVHLEDDIEEDEDRALAGHDAAASTSRGLQAKLGTVWNMLRIMENWTLFYDGRPTRDAQMLRTIMDASDLLRKHVAANGIRSGPERGNPFYQENGPPYVPKDNGPQENGAPLVNSPPTSTV
ncbi:hypothetical protein R1flu_006398 [Riccia fluitans]|uniref:Uncharacterized protein n=1 Tax=Riccia fluitans TaxID=41844 RepID=A0ABD1YWY3_9MARC